MSELHLFNPDLSHMKGVRVIAAMSGGVDSSVMAALLADAGVDVIGVFLHVWDYSRDDVSRHGSCCATEDAYDARRVAGRIGIPFYAMDMRETFREHVIDPFVADYASGRTPNPCERCNRFVKFGALLEAADRLEARFIATGHYARRRDGAGGVRIYRGADEKKDQSYFLATINRDQAARILFPVGHLKKDETRRLAREFELPTADKHESQDICFIPSGDRIAFLKREEISAGFQSGDIVDRKGKVLGKHQGIAHYTLGQRRGLGLSGGPWHVVGLDGEADGHGARVVVAPHEEALIRMVDVDDATWIRRPDSTEAVAVRVRYQSRPAPCRISMEAGNVRAVFDSPQQQAAPGQVAAFYAGDELLGGGIISRIEPWKYSGKRAINVIQATA